VDSRAGGMRGKGGALRAAVAVAAVGTLLLACAGSASAMTYAMNFRTYDTGDIGIAQRSGASVYRIELDFTCTAGGANWGQFDPIVEAAWKRGITILPILLRSYPTCEATEHKRFLNSGDGNWGAWYWWARAAVERYGINGSFWNGKASPRPITAWEVGNEPNLAENNPGGNVVQPQAYGAFLKYTSEALQAGSIAKTGVGTNVLVGGLYMQGGYYFGSFIQDMGASSYYTGVAIHPYSFYNGPTGVTEEVTGIRSILNNNVPGGGSKSLWITEMGWPVAGTEGLPPGASPVSESQQATYLNQSFDWIESAAAANQIQLVTWYKIQDQSVSGNRWTAPTGRLGMRSRGRREQRSGLIRTSSGSSATTRRPPTSTPTSTARPTKRSPR
jgi:hypothetical protein